MTRFGPRIYPITFPTPGECTNCYATDAGTEYKCRQRYKIQLQGLSVEEKRDVKNLLGTSYHDKEFLKKVNFQQRKKTRTIILIIQHTGTKSHKGLH